MPLRPGSSFTGLRVHDDPEFLSNLNEIADWICALREMQVHGAPFERSRSGISIAIPESRIGGGGGSMLTAVRLSAFDSTNKIYTGVKQVADDLGGYEDVDPVVNLKCFEIRDFIGIELGAIVWVQKIGAWAGSASVMDVGTAIYGFSFVLPRQTFDVVVVQTGGSNGTGSTAASYTYRVDNADGHVLATAKAPVFTGFRIGVGPVTAGTRGIASYDDAGTLSLLMVNEVHGADDECA